jgi:multiple sugar transport system substrate-binding protein
MEVEPMAMYYSIRAFEEAGLSDKDVPKTYDELLEVAKKLTKPDRFGALFETAPGGYQVFTWYPFMWMGGGDVTDEDGKHSKFNHPGTVSALKLWKDLVDAEAAPRECLGGGAWNVAANLGAGYCAMQNCGIWGLSQMRDQAPNFKFGVFRLPQPPEVQPISVAGGWAFVANARGQNVDAAARFIAWAIGSPEKESKQRVLDWCTQAKSDMSPRRSVTKLAMDNGSFSAGPMKVFADEILPTVRGEPRTPPAVWQLITDAIQSCMLNNQDPAKVAKSTNDKIEAFLATYQGARIL